MSITVTLIIQGLAFLAVAWLVMKFGWPMILGAIEERQKKIADGLAAAEKGQQDLAEATTRAEAIVREARDRARQIEDQASKRANDAIDAARQTAQSEGARIVDAAREEAVTETHRARDALRREYGALVVAGAAQLLEREVDAKAHAQLIDKLAAEIARG
ncbi:MAG: F0F1 ATP synthase subunit B [Steroidobacteraceae bacterium]|jgi:F-type H+-transporting ATPase subunit b|nr:F0F1 ATP synthase subunit B [Gammaproteobacteria bacterium]